MRARVAGRIFMKLLVIDDNPQFRQMLMTWLIKESHFVRGVDGGSPETLDALKHWDYDVITLDLMMPKASGLALLSHLRVMCPETPVIIISASANVRVAVQMIRSGAVACFDKPLDLEAFRNELNRLNCTRQLHSSFDHA
jgi:CheY-like chemotaxis protein